MVVTDDDINLDMVRGSSIHDAGVGPGQVVMSVHGTARPVQAATRYRRGPEVVGEAVHAIDRWNAKACIARVVSPYSSAVRSIDSDVDFAMANLDRVAMTLLELRRAARSAGADAGGRLRLAFQEDKR
ncbi:hypothetical protein [Nocardia asteroides]|uniref:hypothetical protein n=1 Tax=Nocardia asteroides TaxID=1824 RepID=UPI0033ECB82E